MKKRLSKIIKLNHSKIKSNIIQIATILLILDQFTKILVMTNLKELKDYIIIKNFFSLYYIKNTGAAFSILENQTIVLIILSLIILVILNNYISLLTKSSKLEKLSLGLILGGILGNLIDRLLYNSVIDFLSFRIFNYNFPVFNIADIGIVVGVTLFVLSTIIDNISEKDAKKIDIEAEIKKIEDNTKTIKSKKKTTSTKKKTSKKTSNKRKTK